MQAIFYFFLTKSINLGYTNFVTKVDAIKDIPEEKKNDYKKRVAETIENTVFPAYQNLIDYFENLYLKVTIPMEKLMEIAYEKEGVKYYTFEVSKLKEADAYGREYTVCYSKLVAEAQEPAPKKKGNRKKKTQK